jgi:hypothetical protein
MRGATMVSTSQWLGIVPSFSRPLFGTLEYTPEYRRLLFIDVEAAEC